MDTPQPPEIMSPIDPMSPPQEAGAMPDVPSKWPTVIGIIAIVFGSLGILAYGCAGLGQSLFMPAMTDVMEQSGALDEATRAQLDVAEQYMVHSMISAGCALILAIVLLVAGIGVIRRKQSGKNTIIFWAILRMVYAVPAAILQNHINSKSWAAMEAAAEESGTTVPPGFMTWMESIGIFGLGCSVLWAWAFPIFVLIWFSRAKIKAEVAQW